MITLSILILIWGIISYYRTITKCKQKNIQFNPFEKSFIDYMDILFFTAVVIVWIISNRKEKLKIVVGL